MNIHEFLDPKAIRLRSTARTSEAIIRDLGGMLYKLGYVKDGFVEATLEREASMPTGLPLGGEINAAIPHVDIEYVNKPALALATLQYPVPFSNMVDPDDIVPVRMVIMLALDKPKSQIEMLQSVSELLQNAEIIDKMMKAYWPGQILNILKFATINS
jgi:PTS system galactitol-specific IIA component